LWQERTLRLQRVYDLENVAWFNAYYASRGRGRGRGRGFIGRGRGRDPINREPRATQPEYTDERIMVAEETIGERDPIEIAVKAEVIEVQIQGETQQLEGAKARVEEQAQQEAKDQVNPNPELQCQMLMVHDLKKYKKTNFKIRGEKVIESQKVAVMQQETKQSQAHLN
jgi:hypothetical protein